MQCSLTPRSPSTPTRVAKGHCVKNGAAWSKGCLATRGGRLGGRRLNSAHPRHTGPQKANLGYQVSDSVFGRNPTPNSPWRRRKTRRHKVVGPNAYRRRNPEIRISRSPGFLGNTRWLAGQTEISRFVSRSNLTPRTRQADFGPEFWTPFLAETPYRTPDGGVQKRDAAR